MFTKNQTNPYFQSVRLGADNAAKQMNATVVHYVPTKPDSIPEQMSQIEDVITKRPDAIVFIPVDSQAMVPGVQKMNAAKIPVVNITDHSAGGDLVSYVGSDEYGLGLASGRYLLDKMKGQGNVIIIEGVRGSHGSGERVRGFQKALEESPQVKLLASQPGNFQRLQALQVTENLLQAHPVIDGVMAANDAMALGAIEALDAANRKALVVGINATKEGIDAVKAGKLLGDRGLRRLPAGLRRDDGRHPGDSQSARPEGDRLSVRRHRQHELQGRRHSRRAARVPEVGSGGQGMINHRLPFPNSQPTPSATCAPLKLSRRPTGSEKFTIAL